MIDNTKKDFSIELLRLLASFMVIVIHVSAYRTYALDPQTAYWQIMNFWNSIASSAVPIFIMISGAFMLNPQIELGGKKLYKKILKLVIVYIVWSVIYAFYITWWEYGIRIDTAILKSVIKLTIYSRYHLWYLPMLIGIYIFTPLLRAMIRGGGGEGYSMRY